MQKEFKTIDEQINILKERGLVLDDENEVKEILLRENYFFLSGYRHLFLDKNNRYLKGTTFREIYSLFLFDRYFRNILFKYLSIIENQLKSVISYQLSKNYGYKEKDYLNYRNFNLDRNKTRKVKDVVEKMKRQIRINCFHHNATKHYVDKYGYIPMWVSVKVLSFGIVCELCSILKKTDLEEVSEVFGVNYNYLLDFLPILSNYRNLCAHEDIVYEHRTEKYIRNCEYHKKLDIPMMDDEYIYGKNDMFAVVIILKYLLREDEFRLCMKEIEYEIEKLDGRIDTISIEKILDRMGFPTNYMDIVDL